MKRIEYTFLLLFFSLTLQAQNVVKEVYKTFANDKPEIINYYHDKKEIEYLFKKEQFNQDGILVLKEDYKKGVLHGKRVKFYALDKKPYKILEENYKNGELNGKVSAWFTTYYDHVKKQYKEQIKEELNYKAGKFHGQQLYYFDLRYRDISSKDEIQKIKKEFNYLDGKYHGKQVSYNSQEAEKEYELYYTNGIPDSVQRFWYGTGKMEYELNLIRGKFDGLQKFWSYNGNEHNEEIWSNGEYIKTTEEWDNGNPKTQEVYTAKLNTSRIKITWRKVLAKKVDFFENKTKHTLQTFIDTAFYTEWYANGQMKRHGIGKRNSYRKNEVDYKKGKWSYWYENGQKKEEGIYKRNKKYGFWPTWDEQGKTISIIDYADNGAKDLWQVFFYFENGNKKSIGFLNSKGLKDIEWNYWYEDSTLKRKETYMPGPYSRNRPFIKEFVEWNKDGSIRMKGSDGKAIAYTYFENGKIKIEEVLVFFKGRKRYEYYEDGIIKTDGMYQENVEGNMVTKNVVDGGIVRQRTEWYSNGNKKSLTQYCDDCYFIPEEFKQKLKKIYEACKGCQAYYSAYNSSKKLSFEVKDGLYEEWFENGQKKLECNYKKGHLKDNQKEWYSDGKPMLDVYFQDHPYNKKLSPQQRHTICKSGIFYNEKGKAYSYELQWNSKSRSEAINNNDYSLLVPVKKKKILEIERNSYLFRLKVK